MKLSKLEAYNYIAMSAMTSRFHYLLVFNKFDFTQPHLETIYEFGSYKFVQYYMEHCHRQIKV